MSHRLTEEIDAWIEEAVERHSMGDKIRWETSLQGTPNGIGLGLVLFMPGALLNAVINSMTIIPNPLGLNEEAVDSLVGEMVEALRTERSKGLSPTNGGPAGLVQAPPA